MTAFAHETAEISLTSGVGAYRLAGAVTGYVSFADGLTDGDQVIYRVSNGAATEVAEGVFTAPDQLSRDRIIASTDNGSPIDWAASGQRIVTLLLDVSAALPKGGISGQILRKLSGADFDAGWQDAPALVTAFLPATANVSERIRIATTEALVFPANFAGSVAAARVAAFGLTQITLNQVTAGVATPIGEVDFAAASRVGAWSSVGGLSHSFAAGDILEWLFPSVADATLADISLTARAVRR